MVELFRKRTFETVSSPTVLPGGARAGDRTETHNLREEVPLSAEAAANLASFATEHRLDLRAIVAGAWAILLCRYSGETDVAFGIAGLPAAAPSQTRPVALHVADNQLLLPWLCEVQEVLLNTQPDPQSSFESAIVFDAPETASNLPLVLGVTTAPQLRITAVAEGTRFAEGVLPRVLRHTATILENLPAGVQHHLWDVPLMTDAEWRDLVIGRNETRASYRANICIHQYFEEQSARTPGAAAVIFRGQSLTYRELDEKASRLAARLRKLGARPDGIIAICAERSLEMMVGLLGVLKSGAAYLPLDPAFPPERVQFMLEDSGASIVVAQDHLTPRLADTRAQVVAIRSVWDGPEIVDLAPSPVEGHNLAYVIYTSGSTGKPKGVMVEHRQVSNFFTAMDQVLGPEPGVWLAVTSISFDISVLELFWTLARGFTIVLQAESGKLATDEDDSVAAQIRNHRVTHLQCTPSMARFLISHEETLEALRGLRQLMLGGEALPSSLVAQLRKVVSGEIFNLYGPTETTVWSAAYRIARDEAVIPIGRRIANTQIYLLNARLKPVPLGAPGELFIGGAGVTRGYLHRPELTAERFLPDPFRPGPSNRMYRTGDLARYRPDGELEFLGRIDHQVKILGFRIEPEEIEAVLGQHPDVRAVAVVAREDAEGEKKLVAWIVPGERPFTIAELRAYAQRRLPAHMVPSAFAIVDALPQTPNRKIDKKALAARPLPQAASGPAPSVHARVEETVANIFREALQLAEVNTHDNFFDLGANSLVMAQVAIALEEALHQEIPLTDLFKYPTIGALTAHLARSADQEAPRRSSGRALSRKEALLERSRNRQVSGG